jgi:hypothetical protein
MKCYNIPAMSSYSISSKAHIPAIWNVTRFIASWSSYANWECGTCALQCEAIQCAPSAPGIFLISKYAVFEPISCRLIEGNAISCSLGNRGWAVCKMMLHRFIFIVVTYHASWSFKALFEVWVNRWWQLFWKLNSYSSHSVSVCCLLCS